MRHVHCQRSRARSDRFAPGTHLQAWCSSAVKLNAGDLTSWSSGLLTPQITRALLTVVLSGALISACARNVDHAPDTLPAPATPGGNSQAEKEMNDLIVLAERNFPAPDGFVVLARDAKTYGVLRNVLSGLPDRGPDFFKSHAVVGGFLGQRRTSGYRVEITRPAVGTIRIAEVAPAREDIVQMVLTAPFKVVELPIPEDKPLSLILDESWRHTAVRYQVTSGELVIKSASSNSKEQLDLDGMIELMQFESLATVVFDLEGMGQATPRSLQGVATGVKTAEGRIAIDRYDSSAESANVSLPLKVIAELGSDGKQISLSFDSDQVENGDRIEVTGKLKANAL